MPPSAPTSRYFGYGVSSFTLSLMETAVALTDGRVSSAGLHSLIDLAKEMMSETVEVFPGVAQTLAALSATRPLMLITKGDLLHQTSKLERSGLQPYFQHVEVVSDKTPAVYRRILDRYGVEPSRFLMIGNSLKLGRAAGDRRRRLGRARAGGTDLGARARRA